MFIRSVFTLLAFVFLQQLAAQIVNIEDRRTRLDTVGWFGQLDLGGRYTKNASEVLTLNGSFRLDRLAQKSNWLLLLDYRMVRAGGSNFLNAGFSHLRYGRPLSPKLTWEAFSQLQYDEKLRLSLRFLAGTGPRLQLADGDKGSIYFGLSYMYEFDELRNESLTFSDHRISSYLSTQWQISPSLKINNTTYYQPRLLDFDDVRVSSVASIVLVISQRISFTTRLNLTHDARINRIFPEVPETTFAWQNGLRLKF